MLVLSRGKNQGIRFPGLVVSVEILEFAGNKVKVGVDAPMEVRILRDELLQEDEVRGEDEFRIKLPQSMQHELRNALNEISLSLRVYLKRIEKEDPHTLSGPIDAEEMFQAIVKRLENVGGKDVRRFQIGDGSQPHVPEARPKVGAALVVDDDDNERELLAGFLRMCDYQVDTVKDGLEAENYLKSRDIPRVILLDMFMPRCDGRKFLATLRQDRKFDGTHVFVVSGSSPTELNMSIRQGYTHWFSKPLDPRRIVESLADIESSVTAS